MSDCLFCDLILKPGGITKIYSETKRCLTIAPLDEYTPGHRLVILKEHHNDIADTTLGYNDLWSFIAEIQSMAITMKRNLRPPRPQRIYVCIMCDGVQHLHAHLIPRYKGDKKGFQFLAEQEKKYDAVRYPEESPE